ncbi:MAG TPA: hypothetical protein DIC23_07765 [Planctomycetaceae bacterium]|jgi:hypothetical protein|nr:hypothetical protein [Planctomycetaceae bacterium]
MLTRRDFVRTAATATTAASTVTLPAAEAAVPEKRKRKTMAIVSTEWRFHSHAQHMGDRFLHGYPTDGVWNQPRLDVVSLYADQVPKNDLSRPREAEFGFKIFPTVAETLRRGGQSLAVDAVLLIGEHGNYPRNELGQKKYPRYELFKKITDVFREDGKSVPVFNDKHLSWKWEWAKEMVDISRELDFPFMAGSSLPVTWRMPSVDLPRGEKVNELMGVAYGGVDSYDFHALETMQCMAERRDKGETGVAWVEGLRGDAFWKAMAKGSFDAGGWSPELFEACLTRTQTLQQPQPTFTHRHPTPKEIREMVKEPVAYRYQHRDGTRATMLLLNGLVRDFTFAADIKGKKSPLSTLFHLPPTPNVQYSAELMGHAEDMFVSGKVGYPVERTLLVSGILAASIESMVKKVVLQTPHLDVRYKSTRNSTFARS